MEGLVMGKSIKKISVVVMTVMAIFVLAVAVCFGFYCFVQSGVVASLGEYDHSVFFTSGGFQDYTDYGKYYYTSAQIAENKYFKRIQETDLAEINEHIDDFEGWVETIRNGDASDEVAVNYDFDREIIDPEDYIHIESEKLTGSGYTTLANYDVYFFDMQTQVLYFFHNNI